MENKQENKIEKECCEKCWNKGGMWTGPYCMYLTCPCHKPKEERVCPICKIYMLKGTGHSHSPEEVEAFRKMFEPKECKHDLNTGGVCIKCRKQIENWNVEPKETEWGDKIGMIRFNCDMIYTKGVKGDQTHWKNKNDIEELIHTLLQTKEQEVKDKICGELEGMTWTEIHSEAPNSVYDMKRGFNQAIEEAINKIKGE